MNNKAQLDFEMDMETIIAIAMGLAAGIISIIVAHSSPVGGFYKILTFLVSTVMGFFIAKFILSR